MSPWYFSKDGAQEGPVTAGQIAALVNASALDRATTLVWREGLADWIPLDQSPVFEEAGARPPLTLRPAISSTPSINPYGVSSETLAASRARFEMPLEYPGIGRLVYFLVHIGTAIASYVLIFALVMIALGSKSRGFPTAGLLLLMAVAALFSLYMSVKRLQNLGMSGWAILWALVPIMNLWIQWRMFACPAGYEDHRTLDTAGKVISGIAIGMLALAVIMGIAGSVLGN